MVIGGGLGMGLVIAANMRRRLSNLKQLEKVMYLLEGELRYRHSTLGDAFANISERTGEPFCEWLANLSNSLSVSKMSMDINELCCTFVNIWNESLSQLYDDTSSYLLVEDIELIKNMGQALGHLDIETQLNEIKLETERLGTIIYELSKVLKDKSRMAVTLSTLGAILVVIILF